MPSLELEGAAVVFIERELVRLGTELKTLHAQLPPLSTSDEIQLLSALKAALGDDTSSNNNNNRSGWYWELFDCVPPTLETLDTFSQNSGGWNSLDRYTFGLLLQLKLKFLIQMKDSAIIISNEPATTTGEAQEKEDMDRRPTPVPADETLELPVPFGINDLMPSESEQQEQRQNYMKAKHREVEEETESKLKLVLELSNVSTEEEADMFRRFHILLERKLKKLLGPKEDEQWKLGEGTRKRPHPNREDDERKNCPKKKSPLAETGRDDYIKGEMNRLAREYERLMKQHLAAFEEPPSMFSHPSSMSVAPPQLVDPPAPTVSIVIHLGWNHTHVGWIPPNKTTIELLVPPVPCLIGLSEDESEVLYGDQIWKAVVKNNLISCFMNLKSMLADKEVEWRRGKGRVRSELPLAMFLIHLKTKIEAAILSPSSTTNYKVVLVLPQALSIVQRGRISIAAKLAGFGEDQVHLMKETTAAALAFAHVADIWSPGSMLPILVCCPPDVLDSGDTGDNADVAIFSNENGILTMRDIAGRQGVGLRKEITKFKKKIAPFAGELNQNSVIVHLDERSYENVPCSQKFETRGLRALQILVKGRFEEASDDILKKIREHLTIDTVRYLHYL
jgi:hypothetical protein